MGTAHTASSYDPPMTNALFICSQNKLRSPTAEAVFAIEPEIEIKDDSRFSVIPAKAGISWALRQIPAFAGMTR